MPNTLVLTDSAARRGDAMDVRHAGRTWKRVLGRCGAAFRGLVVAGVVVVCLSLMGSL
jgi:hypothetical protein